MKPLEQITAWSNRLLESQYAALILILISDFTFVWMDATAQHLENVHGLPTGQVGFLRFVSA